MNRIESLDIDLDSDNHQFLATMTEIHIGVFAVVVVVFFFKTVFLTNDTGKNGHQISISHPVQSFIPNGSQLTTLTKDLKIWVWRDGPAAKSTVALVEG